MREINFPDNNPRFNEDMCEPLFDIIRGLHLDQKKYVLDFYWQSALDMKNDEPEEHQDITTTDLALENFLWNININQPLEDNDKDNALLMFMAVANRVWKVKV